MSNVTNRETPTAQDTQNRQRVAASQGRPEDRNEPASRAGQEADMAKRQASDAARDLKAQVREMKHTAAEQSSEAAAEARRSAIEAAERVRAEGTAIVSRQKDAAAEELEHLRGALDAAAAKLEEEGDNRVADVVHIAADRVETLARYVRDRDLQRLVDDASHFARRRPEVFYGGLFMAGLAASRFLKASSDRGRHGY